MLTQMIIKLIFLIKKNIFPETHIVWELGILGIDYLSCLHGMQTTTKPPRSLAVLVGDNACAGDGSGWAPTLGGLLV